jgi:polar amino acid transport system substrate-binding protein
LIYTILFRTFQTCFPGGRRWILSLSSKYQIILLSFLFILPCSIQAKDILRWAADAESGAPYVFQDPRSPDRLIGFEDDIVKAIADELEMKPVFVQNQWDGLIPGLYRNDYDIAINGIEITEDRKREVNFSVPYYLTYEQLVIRKDQQNIYNLDDLRGKSVGTLKASVAERILVSARYIDVRTYDAEVGSFKDLKNGRLSAVLIDAPVAVYYAGWDPELKFTGQPIGDLYYGIALRKSDTLLLKKINGAINKLVYTGRLREIMDSWNLWNYAMAVYFSDKGNARSAPYNFDAFVSEQKPNVDFHSWVNRYAGLMPLFLRAALVTLGLSVIAMILAIVAGLIIGIIRVYAPSPLRVIAVIYIEIIRGTPLLIQLFFIFYALPGLGIKLSPFLAAVLGLGLNYAAYEAENYRAGIFSVPKGQMEAAIALGMRRRQALRHIILPQAARLVIPPITNDFISLLKDSSLVSVITMVELTKVYLQVAATYYDYFVTGLIVAAIYLILGLPFVRIARYAEKKLALEGRVRKETSRKQGFFGKKIEVQA